MPVASPTNGVFSYNNPPAGTPGRITTRVSGLNYGASIGSTETESPKFKSIYFDNLVFDDFTVTVTFDTYKEYESVSNWMDTYTQINSDPSNGPVSPMLVTVKLNLPQYKGLPQSEQGKDFGGFGILQSGVTYGDTVGMITYDSTYQFIGTSDLLSDLSLNFEHINGLSTGPSKTSFFYPSGNQVSSSATPVEELLYDGNGFQSIPSSVL